MSITQKYADQLGLAQKLEQALGAVVKDCEPVSSLAQHLLEKAPAEIVRVHARQIFDSRGNPTVECDVVTRRGLFRAAVPSGASTGVHEAVELRDGDKSSYMGKGVLKAVNNVNTILAPALLGMNPVNQKEIDEKMIALDGTENKANLGANAILAVSIAVCKAGAAERGVPLYQHIADLAGNKQLVLPVPAFNVVNGGVHAGNALAMQEFMILPVGAKTFAEAMKMGTEVYHTLKALIKAKYGIDACNVGDEGGFAPCINSSFEALDVVTAAIDKAGYTGKIRIGVDAASSEFLCEDGNYDLNFKQQPSNKKTPAELIEMYKSFVDKYPMILIEDPFEQDDWEPAKKLTALNISQVIGDDMLVTNPKRIAKAIEEKVVNGLLLKVNQIGTITESIKATGMAKAAGWSILASHRSGETEDSFLADLSVGLAVGQLKTGAPCRSERLAKYNQLLRIEEELGDKAVYAGGEKPICAFIPW